MLDHHDVDGRDTPGPPGSMSSVRTHRLNDESCSTNHNQNHNKNNAITMPAITTAATAMALAHAG
jgi:hypothetical protein